MEGYEDILHLPHHRSAKRRHMSMQDRAAQFSPFAALTGFDDQIEETGRQTDCRPEFEEYGNACLDYKLNSLAERVALRPFVTIACFVPDERKTGGYCRTIQGNVRRIDSCGRVLHLTDGREIPLGDILNIDSEWILDWEK